MVELTLGDLLRWKSTLLRLVGSAEHQGEVLEQEISWAVCIRSTIPVLPPLRGREIVIVPEAVLNELSSRESIGWAEVVNDFESLPISGIVSDHPAASDGVPGVTVVEVLSAADPGLESALNRDLTARRGDLYQLGSDLARSFSSASIGGTDLNSFLRVAEQRTGIQVALMTLSGRLLATSDDEFRPAAYIVDEEVIGHRTTHKGIDWIGASVTGAGLPEGVVLLTAIPVDEPGDKARLVLEQTGEALGLMFDRLPPLDALSPHDEATRILGELGANGVLTAAARRRLVQLAPDVDLDGPLRLVVDLDRPDERSPGVLAFEANGVWLTMCSEQSFLLDNRHENICFVSSGPLQGIESVPGAIELVLRMFKLRQSGNISGDQIDLGAPLVAGAFGMLLNLDVWSGDVSMMLERFAEAALAALESYDRARGMNLVETLAAYLDAGAVAAIAAANLGVHRNTLAYRIARITEVSGYDLTDPAARFDLQCAIAIRRIQSS